jgi:hypothetical protein
VLGFVRWVALSVKNTVQSTKRRLQFGESVLCGSGITTGTRLKSGSIKEAIVTTNDIKTAPQALLTS